MSKASSVKVNDTKLNYQGLLMKVKEWYSRNHLIVEFEDGYIKEILIDGNQRWKKGNIRNPNIISVYGKGYLGGDEYNYHKDRYVYKAWNHMLERCYTEQYKKIFPTYIGCTVCDEWLNFQNFAKWYYDNLWLDLKDAKLDKDILQKHNKIYSPATCVLVNNHINCLFTKCNKDRGQYPIGVSIDKRHDNIRAYVYIDGRQSTKYTPNNISKEERIQLAFNWYKQSKEEEIKRVADLYKSEYPNFPQKLYDAMCTYEVEITD
jgi:hypothetical protein